VNATLGAGLILVGLAFATLGALLGIVGGVTRREAVYPWVRRAAAGFLVTVGLANAVMVYALLTRDFSVSYVAQVGSHATPTVYTIVSLWSSLEGSILFWGLILSSYVFVFAWLHRKAPPRFVALATGVMLAVGVFFAFLIAGPANPFTPTPLPIPLDGPGPNPLLQNHILMVIHPPMLYLGYVGMTVPFGIALAGLLGGEMGDSWMAPLRRWTMVPWLFLTIGIILGSWWAYAVLGWGGYWAWDPVENASFLPWLTATAFMHSTMVQERRRMLKLWTIGLALASFWLTILGTFMTRSGIFNSVHSFTQSDIGPTFLVFLGVLAVVCIGALGFRGHLLAAEGTLKSVVSREVAILVNNVLFASFTFVVLLGTVYPLLAEGLFNKRLSVGEPYFNFFAVPIGLMVLFLMGVGPALPWGKGDVRSLVVHFGVPAAIGGVTAGLAALSGMGGFWPLLTFGLAGFVSTVTLREMFLPAYVRMRDKKEAVHVAVWESASRARRRFGGYVVHLGMVVIIVAVAASSAFVTHTSGTLREGGTLTLGSYVVAFNGLAKGKEPHREWIGARLSVTGTDDATPKGELFPRMNFYETSTDPIGTPAVRSVAHEDLYVSLMAFDDKANTASLKVWIFPLVGWIWWSIPILVVGTLISIWPSRKAKLAASANPPGSSAGSGSGPGPDTGGKLPADAERGAA
jgi:cytochrome c-type biogenesis protein CcmF